MAPGELALPLQQIGELGLHEMLVEQLAAGDAVDLARSIEMRSS